jgi:hypothetical protein
MALSTYCVLSQQYSFGSLPGVGKWRDFQFLQHEVEPMVPGNACTPAEPVGGASPLSLLPRPLRGQQREQLPQVDGNRTEPGLSDLIPAMLPRLVIRARGQHVVKCLHEVLKPQGCRCWRSSFSGGGKPDMQAALARRQPFGTVKYQPENCCAPRQRLEKPW